MNKRHIALEDNDSDDGPNLFYRQASSKMIVKSNQEMTHQLPPDDESEEEPRYCLPYLQAVLCASILEDGVTQFRILGECNNELRIIKTLADKANLVAKKYQISHGKVKDELSGINSRNLGSTQYKLDKLAADRTYCNEVLMGTYLDLSLTRCYSTLTDSNRDVEDRDMHRVCLNTDEARNRTYRRELMRQLRQQRNHHKTIAYDTDLVIDQLKSKVEDAALNAETRSRFITNWQRSRTEQHQQTIHDREEGPSTSISYYRRRTDYEQRIHAEVELLVNIFINETLHKVETWMNKYDIDMEAIDLKIQIMKNKYQNARDKRIEMEEAYAYHEVLMKNWNKFKKDREDARKYHDLMTKSAIIVQAWWRGLLVRLELGPYKPMKKKPAPKPAAKKKK